jgi:hypothetical protein
MVAGTVLDVETTILRRTTNSSTSILGQLPPTILTPKSLSQAEIARLWCHQMQSIRFKRRKTAMERPLTLTSAKLDLRVVSMTAHIWCIDLILQLELTGIGV